MWADTLWLFSVALSVAVVGLNMIDAILTDKIIERGGVEKNPVMAFIMSLSTVGRYRWAIKLAIVVGVLSLIWGYTDGITRALLLAAFTAPFVWVVWHNRNVLNRMNERQPVTITGKP